MIDFGLIDQWTPPSGRLTQWAPSEHGILLSRSASEHPVPPSHQQQAYVQAAARNTDIGYRFSRLCVMTFDIDGPLDTDAMTTAVNAFVRRHDTFRSWFRMDQDDNVIRHIVDKDALDMVAIHLADHATGDQVRHYAQNTVPGPLEWACFAIGAIDRGTSFTVYVAVDHLHSDGMSQALCCADLLTLYHAATHGQSGGNLEPAGSYLEYCHRERRATAQMSLNDPAVQQWVTLLDRNDKKLPRFPLALGLDCAQRARSRAVTFDLLDEHDGIRLDEVCVDVGVRFVAAVLAAAAVAAYEFTGQYFHLGFTPKSTRRTPEERNAVGWFANLVPFVAEITSGTSFRDVLRSVNDSYEEHRGLAHVPFHRVLELLPCQYAIPMEWVVPMISYIDVRRLPGAVMFDHVNLGVYGNRGSSDEVYSWVNRFPGHTSMSMLYPDTLSARDSVDRYIDRYTSILRSVAATGDYTPTLGSDAVHPAEQTHLAR